MEDRFRLSSITRLLSVITTLPLNCQTVLTFLVLSNLMQGVLLAFLVFAICLLCFWNVNLYFNINVLLSPLNEIKTKKY